jgi:hypothetical protein
MVTQHVQLHAAAPNSSPHVGLWLSVSPDLTHYPATLCFTHPRLRARGLSLPGFVFLQLILKAALQTTVRGTYNRQRDSSQPDNHAASVSTWVLSMPRSCMPRGAAYEHREGGGREGTSKTLKGRRQERVVRGGGLGLRGSTAGHQARREADEVRDEKRRQKENRVGSAEGQYRTRRQQHSQGSTHQALRTPLSHLATHQPEPIPQHHIQGRPHIDPPPSLL